MTASTHLMCASSRKAWQDYGRWKQDRRQRLGQRGGRGQVQQGRGRSVPGGGGAAVWRKHPTARCRSTPRSIEAERTRTPALTRPWIVSRLSEAGPRVQMTLVRGGVLTLSCAGCMHQRVTRTQ